MTLTEAQSLIGQCGRAALVVNQKFNIHVPVVIRDVRSNYGRTDLKCEPKGGEGEFWITEEKVKLRK